MNAAGAPRPIQSRHSYYCRRCLLPRLIANFSDWQDDARTVTRHGRVSFAGSWTGGPAPGPASLRRLARHVRRPSGSIWVPSTPTAATRVRSR